MMDQKTLEEIKARCDAGRPTARIDVKALIAEVERLTKENQGLRANSEVQESIISGGRNPADKEQIVRLTMDNAAKDQQIAMLEKANSEWDIVHTADNIEKATLKRALELVCKRNAEYAFCGGTDAMKAKHAEKNFQHFIQQAQEQLMHESTYECDKSALEQEEKSNG